MRPLLAIAGALALGPTAKADDAGAPVETRLPPVQPKDGAISNGFRFIGLLQTRGTMTSLSTTNPFLDGQVVGVLGGSNGVTTSDEERALYVEQRGLGFFSFAPPVLDGRVEMNAAFEVDYLWGDQSYSVGGNTGGAFGADQVNLQTRRLYGVFRPTLRGGSSLSVVAGLQFVSDGVADPASAKPDDLFRGGGKLMFWGSEASGVTVYGRYKHGTWELGRARLGAYTLYEESVGSPDDVTLMMADAAFHPAIGTWLGVHGWMLRDRAGGLGGGLLGSGPTSALAELQGAASLDLRPGGEGAAPEVDADLFWGGVDASYNLDLSQGRVGVTGLAVANLGRLYVTDLSDVSVMGFLANAELRLKWAPGAGSVARVEGLWSSADDEDTERYTGIVTGNSYGIVGAVYASHGMVLLFADPLSIDRSVAAVYDVSAGGAGLLAVTGQLGYDLVPNRVSLVAGAGTANNGAGDALGTELNLRLRTHPWLLGNLDLVGAALMGTEQPALPWAAYLYVDALVF